ncbi:site-2 protease family protein [Bacillus aerolatus]|uniref:Site-2 protease family protein n=1 Tax=Bacillus aerolatus TaxID=2653354 RepID=A0A6I1FMI2_9BACI|nr:site-2 protease family protein [Bacillus aerolatus]KAB7707509.1 site-2 protease family protein [Bacillus aerolatus]
MDRFLAFSMQELPFVVITLIVAFTFHEFAHAYVAYKFGDDTAKDQGRLTLNPVHHLDPIGTILILIAGFGWARPVPVNRRNFQNPRLAGILVSLAGPLSNFLIAAIAYGILFFFVGAGMPPFFIDLLNMMVWLNVVLFVFNLLPLPPLDGYRIIEDLAPPAVRVKLTKYEQYGTLIFLIIVITPLYQYTIQPIFSIVLPSVIQGFNTIFMTLFG